MCGIAGGQAVTRGHLDAMLQRLRHRGPDQTGSCRVGDFSLGMTRLAILDAKHGQQPFRSPCGRITAVCNGELYNWRSLRTELEGKGHRFASQCDCEILPAAWLEWGPALFPKLNGMFALAIHDAREDQLTLARDRCGQKPLYLTSNGPFRFASEIKALAAAGVPLKPDPSQLASWLSLRYLPEPQTLYQDLITLPSAHWMTVSADGEVKTERYWKPENQLPHPAERKTLIRQEPPLDTLDQLTHSSVELALQSDVPVAAYLSGGVDSALLAHYIKDLGADVTTVSIGFGAASDETPAAIQTADHLGLPHHPTQLTPDSLQNLPRVIHQMDRPIGDALILAFDHLAGHTTSLGCKVALGGEGPDEHFAGYSFQRAYLAAKKIGPLGRLLAATAIDYLPSRIIDKLANFPASLGPEGRAKTARYLREFPTLSIFDQTTRLHTLFEPHEIQSLLHPDVINRQIPHSLHDDKGQDPRSETFLALQYQHWLPDWSLIRQDKNTMAHSLEYRAPFLDHRLIDFAFSQPLSAKINRTTDKVLWRQLAARHLPHDITHRPKQPFYLPLEHPSWRTPLIEMARDVLAPAQLARHGWLNPSAIEPLFAATHFLPLKQLTALMILQLWLNEHQSPW